MEYHEYHEMVTSPYYGVVKKIGISNGTNIYEWEQLFLIETEFGTIESIEIGVSGLVESLEVREGDKVVPGMVLAYIKEDLFVTGSD